MFALAVVLAMAGLGVACGEGDVGPGAHALALEARCTARVAGVGDVDVETDYLPHVVQCENGAAPFEALMVQAVAARSYLYYRLEEWGEVEDGPRDQVYSCGRQPTLEQRRAVDETSGVYLRYAGATVASFYVAGAHGTPAACDGDGLDPTGTEHWVTYNEGRSGDEVRQTTLGRVDGDNVQNRGCSSQNGAACLAVAGRSWREILGFYYGEDIGIAQATGPCVSAAYDRDDAGTPWIADAGADAAAGDLDAGDAPSRAPGLRQTGCQIAEGSPDVSFALVVLMVLGTRLWPLNALSHSGFMDRNQKSRGGVSCGAAPALLPSQTGGSVGSSRGTS